MKKFSPFLLGIFIILSLFIKVPTTHSDQLDDINSQIAKLQQQLNDSVNATKPLQSQVQSMQAQLASIKSQLAYITVDIANKKVQIAKGETQLSKQVNLLNNALADYYIKSYSNTPLLLILSSSSAADITQLSAYQKAATDEDKLIVTNTVMTIQDLQILKKNLEDEQTRLEATTANLNQQSDKLNQVIAQAKTYQSSLSNQIATL